MKVNQKKFKKYDISNFSKLPGSARTIISFKIILKGHEIAAEVDIQSEIETSPTIILKHLINEIATITEKGVTWLIQNKLKTFAVVILDRLKYFM